MRTTSLGQWGVLVGLAGVVAASPAAAQSFNPAAVLESLDFGAIVNRASVSATVDTAYETNVSHSNAALAAARGLTPADEIVSPTLLLDILQPVGRNSVFLAGSAAYNFYDHNTILNRENLALNGGFHGQLGSCRATLSGGYDRRQNSLEDETQQKVKDTFDSKTVSLNGTCGKPIGFAPVASVTQIWSDNSGAILFGSNSRSFISSGGLAYHAPTFGVLSFFGQYQSTFFENRLLSDGANSIHDSFEIYAGGVRYERMLGARIQGTASVTYSHVSTAGGGSDFSGLTYDTDLTYRASSRIGFHGSFNRDILPANSLNASYRIATNETIEANYRLGSRLGISAGAADRQSRLNGAVLNPLLDLNRSEDKSIYASANYSLRRISFGLTARNDHRTANVAGLAYWDTRVDLSIGTKF